MRRKRSAKPARVRKGSGPSIEGDFLERWEGSSLLADGGEGGKAGLEDFLGLYGAHPWVYSCVNAIAQAMSSVRYRLLKNGEEVKEDPLLEVFKRPNPHQSWFEFMEATAIYLELTGNVFWEEVRTKDAAKNLVGLYPLRPDRVKIMPHPRLKIAGYRYEPPRGDVIPYDAEEITHIKYFNPKHDLWGMGPAVATQSGLTLDFWAISYNKGFFKRGSEPGFVLELEEGLSEPAYQRLLDTWRKRHQGVDKSHAPAILEEGMKYKPIGISHKDMEFTAIRRMSREEILGVWRVPPVMVGLLEFANYATSREQKKTFWMDNILVKLARIESIINAAVMPKGLEFKFITESIASIVEDEQIASNIAQAYVSHGLMTINEARKKWLNLPPVPWGDKWWAPVGLAPVDSGLHPGAAQANNSPFPQNVDGMETGLKGPDFAPGLPGAQAHTPELASANLVGSELEPFERLQKAEPNWDDPKETFYWQRWTFWKQLANPDVKGYEKSFRTFLHGQGERFRQKISAAAWPKSKKKQDDLKLEFAKVDLPQEVEGWLVFFDEDKTQLLEAISKQAQKILRKHGNTSLGQLGIRADFNLRNPAVESYLSKYAGQRVSGINATTRAMLRTQLTQAVQQGEDFQDVLKRIGNVFDGPLSEFRARRIGRTEVVTLTNQAKLQAAKQSGIVTRKVWISELLDSTRDPHRDIHGTVLPIDAKFKVKSRSGMDEMEGPGDLAASAENVVNCLCVIDYPPDTPEFQDLFEEDVRGAEKRDVAKGEAPPANGEAQPITINLTLPPPPAAKAEPRVIGKTVKIVRDEHGAAQHTEEKFVFEQGEPECPPPPNT